MIDLGVLMQQRGSRAGLACVLVGQQPGAQVSQLLERVGCGAHASRSKRRTALPMPD